MFDKETLQLLQRADAIERANNAIAAAGIDDGSGACALSSDIEVADLERYLPKRRRARGAMKTADIASYVAYIKSALDTAADAPQVARTFVDDVAMRAVTVLDYGTHDMPLHCDHTAALEAKKTAEYEALLAIADKPKSQRDIAEFLEDWAPNIECDGDGVITAGQAASAVRRLTIEAARKQEHVDENLSASKSTFESVTASSSLGLPKIVRFMCVPYLDLELRTFELRISVRLTGDTPTLVLRSVKPDEAKQQMSDEFGALVRSELTDTGILVVHGVYAAAK